MQTSTTSPTQPHKETPSALRAAAMRRVTGTDTDASRDVTPGHDRDTGRDTDKVGPCRDTSRDTSGATPKTPGPRPGRRPGHRWGQAGPADATTSLAHSFSHARHARHEERNTTFPVGRIHQGLAHPTSDGPRPRSERPNGHGCQPPTPSRRQPSTSSKVMPARPECVVDTGPMLRHRPEFSSEFPPKPAHMWVENGQTLVETTQHSVESARW